MAAGARGLIPDASLFPTAEAIKGGHVPEFPSVTVFPHVEGPPLLTPARLYASELDGGDAGLAVAIGMVRVSML